MGELSPTRRKARQTVTGRLDFLRHLVAAFENLADCPVFKPLAEGRGERRLIQRLEPIPQVSIDTVQLVHHAVARELSIRMRFHAGSTNQFPRLGSLL